MKPAALRRRLLDLIGTRRLTELADLSVADITALSDLAFQHRLQPLLHHQHRAHPDLPVVLARSWNNAFRYQALLALGQRTELERTVGLLRMAGFAPLALKGAWLSRYAYGNRNLRVANEAGAQSAGNLRPQFFGADPGGDNLADQRNLDEAGIVHHVVRAR